MAVAGTFKNKMKWREKNLKTKAKIKLFHIELKYTNYWLKAQKRVNKNPTKQNAHTKNMLHFHHTVWLIMHRTYFFQFLFFFFYAMEQALNIEWIQLLWNWYFEYTGIHKVLKCVIVVHDRIILFMESEKTKKRQTNQATPKRIVISHSGTTEQWLGTKKSTHTHTHKYIQAIQWAAIFFLLFLFWREKKSEKEKMKREVNNNLKTKSHKMRDKFIKCVVDVVVTQAQPIIECLQLSIVVVYTNTHTHTRTNTDINSQLANHIRSTAKQHIWVHLMMQNTARVYLCVCVCVSIK